MRWILYTLVLLAILILAGFLFPREVTLERSVTIDRSPETVFPYLNDFHNFNRWSPWYQLDPDTEYSYSGPREGTGAKMQWRSDNPSVGSGSQTITASDPYSLVATELDFGEQGTAEAEFRLRPQGSGTNVTWHFKTDMGPGPVGRWMGLMVKNMVGSSYRQGLEKLKAVAEAGESTEAAEPEEDIDNGSDTELPSDPIDNMGANPEGMESESGLEGQITEEEAEEPIEDRH